MDLGKVRDFNYTKPSLDLFEYGLCMMPHLVKYLKKFDMLQGQCLNAIVGKDPGRLQGLLRVAEEHSLEINFRFNPTKCEVMNCEVPEKLYGEDIPSCTQFKYLGVWFNARGADWKVHFEKMIGKARNVIQFWRTIGFNGQGLKLRTRRMIYTTFIRPVVEYGLAISPKLKALMNKLGQVQGQALCTMFGTHKTSSRTSMETLLNITNFEYRRVELQARWIMRARKRDGYIH
jgi:hypothetical protein